MLKPALTFKMVKENMFINQSLSHRVIPRESTDSAYVVGFFRFRRWRVWNETKGKSTGFWSGGSGAEVLERRLWSGAGSVCLGDTTARQEKAEGVWGGAREAEKLPELNSNGVTVESTDRRVEPATMVKFPRISTDGAAWSRAWFSFSAHSCSSESSHVLSEFH